MNSTKVAKGEGRIRAWDMKKASAAKKAAFETHREAVEGFLTIARADTTNKMVVSYEENAAIGVWTRDGKNHEALAILQDSLDNWTIVGMDGIVRQFLATEVW